MDRRSRISLVAGIVVSGVALFLAFRNVPFTDLVAYAATIQYKWIVPSLAVALASFLIRVFRWRIILGSAHRVGMWDAYHPMIIGFMVNCILPGRVGEIVRPLVLRERSGVPVATGLATVGAERVLDMVLLIAMLAWVMATMEVDPNLEITFGGYRLSWDTIQGILSGMVQLSAAAIGGIVLLSLPAVRKPLTRWAARAPFLLFFLSQKRRKTWSDRLQPLLERITENIAAGFSEIRSFWKLALCLLLSALIWLLVGWSYQLMAYGCPGIDLTFTQMVAVMVIICFAIALPSVPGYWGIWETGGVFALYLFGISATDASGFTLVNHAVQILPVMVLGFISVLITGTSLRRSPHRTPISGTVGNERISNSASSD
jgi:uncharacterized protein (TIRG00374 family)